MRRFFTYLFCYSCLLVFSLQAQQVTIESGPIKGKALESGVHAYLGIPYAKAPVGDLRWKPPVKPDAWAEVLSCVEHGNIAPQPHINIQRRIGLTQDEDCLNLNVYTKPGGEKKPVMVWIHGGGMTVGASSQKSYNGDVLAQNGVVLVSMNYRLGPMGFYVHPALSAESEKGVSGNYGLLDQIHALKWVRDNIEKFGGDPNNVTIFGESAGAVSVACLLVSPLSEGLFHRAILQSGTAIGITKRMADQDVNGPTYAQGLMLSKKLGVEGDDAAALTKLRKVEPKQFLEVEKVKVGPGGKGTQFGPVIDGYVLPDNPMLLIKEGKFHRVPILNGSNKDEMTMFIRGLKIRREAGYEWFVKRRFKEDAAEVLKVFPVKPGQTPTEAFMHLSNVVAFNGPARVLSVYASRHDVPVYHYFFSRVSELGKKTGMGAKHGIEIAYIFDTSDLVLNTDLDRKLGKQIRGAWIHFARSGDPNHDGLGVTWSKYDEKKHEHLEFGDTTFIGKDLYKAQCDLIQRFAEEQILE